MTTGNESVTVVFSALGGTGVCEMPHTGLPLRRYLRDPALMVYGLLNRARKRVVRNKRGDRLRLSYCPAKGDVVVVG